MCWLLENESTLETIRIHKSELASVILEDEENEISVNGEMYDVKDRSMDGDYIVFHCLSDKKETKLIAGLDTQTKYNSGSNSSSEKKQDNSPKNPVKDLFIIEKNTFNSRQASIVFPVLTHKLQNVILPALPIPPPEVSLA